MMGYFIIGGLLSMVGLFVSNRLKSKFKKYSQIGISSGMTGREVAEAMLRHYGISQVKIVEGKGYLSDHYNPLSKTVALSPQVFHGRSIAAAAVAAHECGHAVQHDTAYSMLQVRSALVPVVNFANMGLQWLLLAAFIFASQALMLVTIIAFAVTTLFAFVTLPVEFDASKRALAWLNQAGVTRGSEHEGAKDALHWAAMTYVSAALSSLVMLVYLVLRYMGSD